MSEAKMKIGILEAGLINEKLVSKFNPYAEMFASFLNHAGEDLEYHSFSVVRGQFPESIEDCDGWLITGSRHGVYENLEWMSQLEAFIQQVYQAQIPLVGICFGHQIVARALGGEVVKSDKGWGVGVTTYSVEKTPSWMVQEADSIRIYAFHQDQVVGLPPGADVFLSSEFCPNAGLMYGDSIISIQAHPEFEEAYELALLKLYSGNVVPKSVADKARQWIDESGEIAETQVLAEWIVNFLIGCNQRC